MASDKDNKQQQPAAAGGDTSDKDNKQQPAAAGGDTRLRREIDTARSPRGAADHDRTLTDGTMTTAAERRMMFRNEFTQEALPRVDDTHEWHYCWLSTTNPNDPIHRRIRIGYEPVRVEDLPGFELYKMRSAEWEGAIGVNEMVLFRIPMDVYQAIMREFHHDAPNEEEQRLKSLVDKVVEDTRDSAGGRTVTVEEGFRELGQRRRVPTF